MFPACRILVASAALLLVPCATVAQYGSAAAAALNGEDAGIVKGQPCVWVEKITTSTPQSDGAMTPQVKIERKWRDSEGRFRREIAKVVDGQEPAYSVATILDPVANTVTTVHMDTKTASVVHLPKGTLHPYVDADDREMLAAAGVQVKVDHLQEKEIMGVRVVGRRVTRTRPPGTIGNDHTIVSVNERWDAPDLKIEMLRTLDDPRQPQRNEVTELRRVEPDAAMFQVPAGYVVKEAEGKPLQMTIMSGH